MKGRTSEFERKPEGRKILGVDPGLGACGLCLLDSVRGVARFHTVRTASYLDFNVRVRKIVDAAASFCPYIPDIVCIEEMVVYRQRHSKGDPNDLIKLAFLSGAIVDRFRPKHLVMPAARKWKGQTPKKIHHARLREQNPWIPEKISMDAMDAVGLALYAKDREYADS